MLEALEHGYAAFYLSKDEYHTYSSAQLTVLDRVIRAKAEPFHMNVYQFTVMPAAMRGNQQGSRIVFVNAYDPQKKKETPANNAT